MSPVTVPAVPGYPRRQRPVKRLGHLAHLIPPLPAVHHADGQQRLEMLNPLQQPGGVARVAAAGQPDGSRRGQRPHLRVAVAVLARQDRIAIAMGYRHEEPDQLNQCHAQSLPLDRRRYHRHRPRPLATPPPGFHRSGPAGSDRCRSPGDLLRRRRVLLWPARRKQHTAASSTAGSPNPL